MHIGHLLKEMKPLAGLEKCPISIHIVVKGNMYRKLKKDEKCLALEKHSSILASQTEERHHHTKTRYRPPLWRGRINLAIVDT